MSNQPFNLGDTVLHPCDDTDVGVVIRAHDGGLAVHWLRDGNQDLLMDSGQVIDGEVRICTPVQVRYSVGHGPTFILGVGLGVVGAVLLVLGL